MNKKIRLILFAILEVIGEEQPKESDCISLWDRVSQIMAASKTARINQALVEFQKANPLKLAFWQIRLLEIRMRREHPVVFLNPAKFLPVQL